jgi:hypothetical protein
LFNHHHHHHWLALNGSDSFTAHICIKKEKWECILTVFFVIIIIKQINTRSSFMYIYIYTYMSVRSRIRCYQEHIYSYIIETAYLKFTARDIHSIRCLHKCMMLLTILYERILKLHIQNHWHIHSNIKKKNSRLRHVSSIFFFSKTSEESNWTSA